MVFFAQVTGGAGAGVWVTGITSILCLSVAAMALSHGEKHITKSDWLFFAMALGGIVVWKLTNNPLSAVIIVSITDALAFLPTFRKAYYKPYEETVILFVLSVVKISLGILATKSLNLTTVFYPAELIVTNGLFVIMVLVRRKQLSQNKLQ